MSSAVSGILAQRLVRKICKYCKIEIDTPPEVAKLGMKPLNKYFAGAGCDKCGQSGYSGRFGVYEFVKIDSEIRRTISGTFNEDDLWACAAAAGTKTLFEDAWMKVEQGQTTVEEVISRVHYKVLR
ncbi:hypothetical protein H8E50_09415 [bacterium]|nr:hypothetical protein [bacterium]